jgi:hypothetical protein
VLTTDTEAPVVTQTTVVPGECIDMSIQKRQMLSRDYIIAIIKRATNIALHGAAKNYINLIQVTHTERMDMHEDVDNQVVNR